jgi:hypothetical protein
MISEPQIALSLRCGEHLCAFACLLARTLTMQPAGFSGGVSRTRAYLATGLIIILNLKTGWLLNDVNNVRSRLEACCIPRGADHGAREDKPRRKSRTNKNKTKRRSGNTSWYDVSLTLVAVVPDFASKAHQRAQGENHHIGGGGSGSVAAPGFECSGYARWLICIPSECVRRVHAPGEPQVLVKCSWHRFSTWPTIWARPTRRRSYSPIPGAYR